MLFTGCIQTPLRKDIRIFLRVFQFFCSSKLELLNQRIRELNFDPQNHPDVTSVEFKYANC